MTPAVREIVRIEHEHAPPCEDRIDLDGCVRCAEPWWSCLCDASRPYRQPSAAELELARVERLSRHERLRGAA